MIIGKDIVTTKERVGKFQEKRLTREDIKRFVKRMAQIGQIKKVK